MEYVTTHPGHEQQAALAALGLQTQQHNASTYWRRSGRWMLHLREGPNSKLLDNLTQQKQNPANCRTCRVSARFHFLGYGHPASEIFTLCYLILVMWENKIWPASGFSPFSPVKSHCNCIYSIKLNELYDYDSIRSKRVILRHLGELGLRPAPMDVQCVPQVFLGHSLRRQRWRQNLEQRGHSYSDRHT